MRGACLTFVLLVLGAACTPDGNARQDSTNMSEGAASAGDSARGLALMNAFRDSLPSHSGNALRCTSCHLDNGTRTTAMPWLGSAANYPRVRARSGVEEDMTYRVNDCITRSLAGKALPAGSRDMRDMVAYLESLRNTVRPTGVDTVTMAGDPTHGAQKYAANCVRCHGDAGQGTTIAPAVWGADSYSIGAGMARQKMLATFLRHNMPQDNPGILTAQDAADIAAYVNAQPRQDYPGKERDWPGGNPPADAAYATDAARASGKVLPPERPVLPRRVEPGQVKQ